MFESLKMSMIHKDIQSMIGSSIFESDRVRKFEDVICMIHKLRMHDTKTQDIRSMIGSSVFESERVRKFEDVVCMIFECFESERVRKFEDVVCMIHKLRTFKV